MVNIVEAEKSLVHRIMKMAGVSPRSIEIEPGTTINIWVPSETLKPPKKGSKPQKPKPVVVLVQGFAAEGIFTWQFQVRALTKKYSVYVPDLLFFGGSTTTTTDRSVAFQAECLAKALKALAVEKCTVVGFSYGGMMAFKMAESHPEMVEALVVSGSTLALTEATSASELSRMGLGSWLELLLPNTVKGVKAQLKMATFMKLWLPDWLYKDYLEVMFTNRKERSELLEALVISNKNFTIPNFSQTIKRKYDMRRNKEGWSSGSSRTAMSIYEVS